MWVVESGCPGTRYGKAYLVFEVFESHAYDDTDKEDEVGVWVCCAGGVSGVGLRKGLRSLFGARASIRGVVGNGHE